MAERRVSVKFSAEVAGYARAMEEASQATKKTQKAAEEAGRATDQQGQAQERAGASSRKSEESSKRTADQLVAEAASAQLAASAIGLKYDADGRLVDSQGKVLNSSQAAAHGLDGFSDSVYLTALAAGEANPALEQTETRLESLSRKAQDVELAGQAMLGFGVAVVAGLGSTAKAAMDWESAWAGVQKTVDGTPAQMAEVEEGLRGLAKTLPATHAEIAGVAEAAGQLGVARDDVVGFTRTMIDLSETTNLTADEAATAIAQISNVMGTMERDGAVGVERFGAALVALGNDGASTEVEIVQMAQRIAGAAKLVGASEADLLAMANAMASVGIEAQLGGGVMSRVMQRMYGDVMTGGEGLETLAEVAGMSAKDFATAFEADPVRAVDSMIKGLNGVKESGGNVIQTMSDLGIKGTEETSVLLRLAGAGDLLSDSLDLGAEAWAANSALADEAAKRYETTEAKIQVAWNNIKDAAIDAGAVLLPMISTVAEGAAGLASAFGALPAPVQGVLTALGGVAGVGALAAGGFILLFPKVMDTVGAFKDLVGMAPKAASGLQKVGKAAGAALGIAAVGLAIAKIAESSYMDDIDTGMGRVSKALAEVAANGPGAASALDELFKDKNGGALLRNVEDIGGALDRTFNKGAGQKFNDWAEGIVNGATGIEGSSQILEDSWSRIDEGLSSLVSSGNAEQAAANFKAIQKAAEEQGISVEDVATLFPQYADALAGVSAEQTLVADGAEVAAEGIAEIGGAAEETAPSLEDVVEALFSLGLISMSSRDSTAAFHDALRSMNDATVAAMDGSLGLGAVLNETATDFDLTTEAGAAANAAFQDIAAAGMTDVEAKAREGLGQPELQENLQLTYDSLINAAEGMHIVGDDAVNLARDVLGVPDNVDINTWMSDAAKKMAGETDLALDGIPKQVDVTVSVATLGIAAALGGIAGIAAAAANVGSASATPSTSWYAPKHNGAGGSGGFASGGAVVGRGSSTSDSINARLSNGEHVFDAEDVQAMGGQSAVYAFRAQLDAGVPPSFASAPAREYSAPSAGFSGSAGSGGTTIEMPITINGATDVNAVRQAVVGDITFLMQKNGVRLGK